MKSRVCVLALCLTLASTAYGQHLLVQPDDSGSVRPDLYSGYINVLMSELRAKAPLISGVDVMPFASGQTGTWGTQRDSFDWGVFPADVKFDPNAVPASLGGKLFRQARERELRKAREAQENAVKEARTAYWTRVDVQLAQARDRLLQRPTNPAPCTSFVDLAFRAAGNDQPQLVITDGVASCHDSDVVPPSPTTALAFVLLPSVSDSKGGAQARAFKTRAERLKRLFPSAVVTAAYDQHVVEVLMTGSTSGRGSTGVPSRAMSEAAPVLRAATTPAAHPVHRPAQPPVQRPAASDRASAGIQKPSVETSQRLTVDQAMTELIAEVQRGNVRESFGPYAGQGFTDADLVRFMADDVASKAASTIRTDPRFERIVAALRELSTDERTVALNAARKPLHKSWTELGRVTPLGQTDAAIRAELIVANAIVDALQKSI